MFRRFVLAVVATAAVSGHPANANAQATASQIGSLQSGSGDDGSGISPYTLWYWVQAFRNYSDASYVNISDDSNNLDRYSLPTASNPNWARLFRQAPAAPINSADDPTLPQNESFFNSSILTDEHVGVTPVFSTSSTWQPQSSSSVEFSSTDVAPLISLFAPVTPTLPGPDAWQGETDSSDAGSIDNSTKITADALPLIVDTPAFDVVASPEPSTFWLFATGFATIAAAGVKRKKAVA